MHYIFTQSFWNHLISNLCFGASHHLLMPLTYCRMRVNVNEKYIIHIPTKPSKSVAAVPAGVPLTRAQRGKERQSTPTQFIISFIDFFFFLLGMARMSATTLYSESIFSPSKISYVQRVNRCLSSPHPPPPPSP